MKRNIQLPLLTETRYKKRKQARPISLTGFNHVIVKARTPILRRAHVLIKEILIETQQRFGTQLRAVAIMPDHVHLVLKVNSRKQFADALRFFSGQVALKLKRGKLWAERAWSRIVLSGRDYKGVVSYVWRNPLKAGIWVTAIDAVTIVNGLLFGTPQAPPTVSQQSFAF